MGISIHGGSSIQHIWEAIMCAELNISEGVWRSVVSANKITLLHWHQLLEKSLLAEIDTVADLSKRSAVSEHQSSGAQGLLGLCSLNLSYWEINAEPSWKKCWDLSKTCVCMDYGLVPHSDDGVGHSWQGPFLFRRHDLPTKLKAFLAVSCWSRSTHAFWKNVSFRVSKSPIGKKSKVCPSGARFKSTYAQPEENRANKYKCRYFDNLMCISISDKWE